MTTPLTAIKIYFIFGSDVHEYTASTFSLQASKEYCLLAYTDKAVKQLDAYFTYNMLDDIGLCACLQVLSRNKEAEIVNA